MKKPDWIYQSGFHGAQNKTRTCTPLLAPAPQAGVSTNFTIWAKKGSMAQRLKGPKALTILISVSKRTSSIRGAVTPLRRCAVCCAQNRTRTCTSSLTLVPETSASTNFAIWAIMAQGGGQWAQGLNSCNVLSPEP